MSQHSNHVAPDYLAEDFEDLAGGCDLAEVMAWDESYRTPLPPAMCPEGLHPHGTCDCPLPF
jgi:hypothetical protein